MFQIIFSTSRTTADGTVEEYIVEARGPAQECLATARAVQATADAGGWTINGTTEDGSPPAELANLKREVSDIIDPPVEGEEEGDGEGEQDGGEGEGDTE